MLRELFEERIQASSASVWSRWQRNELSGMGCCGIQSMRESMQEKMMRNWPQLLWLTCCAGVLLLTLMRHDERDIGIVFVYLMSALTFPIGVVVVAAVAWSAAMLATTGQPTPSGPIIQGAVGVAIWALITAVGYLQWFVFLPWLWQRWKAHKGRTNEQQ